MIRALALFIARTVNKEAAEFLNVAEGPFGPIDLFGGKAAYALLDAKVLFKRPILFNQAERGAQA